MKIVLAALAVLALGTLDYFVLSAAFLDVPKLGEGLLALVALGAIIAWLLSSPLPLFVAQNVLMIAAAWHAIEAGSRLNGQAALTLAATFALGNGLVWLATRALPRRTGRSAT